MDNAAMPFAVALNAKFLAHERANKLSRSKTVAAVTTSAGFAPSTIYRHLSGDSLPRSAAAAQRYADAFGCPQSRTLVRAWRKDRAMRDAGDVVAHIARMTGAVLVVFALACVAACVAAGHTPADCIDHVWKAADVTVDGLGKGTGR